MGSVIEITGKSCGKGENAGYQHFFPFPHIFLKIFLPLHCYNMRFFRERLDDATGDFSYLQQELLQTYNNTADRLPRTLY